MALPSMAEKMADKISALVNGVFGARAKSVQLDASN